MDRQSSEREFVNTAVNVRYAETDQMGVVHHANYLVWFEIGRVAWCRARGFRYREMEIEDRCFMAVAEASCRYKVPARFEDDVRICTSVASATDKVIRFHYEILNEATGSLLATGETVHVVTDSQLRPTRIPERYRPIFGLPPRRKSRS